MSEPQLEHEETLIKYQRTLSMLISLATFGLGIVIMMGWHYQASWIPTAQPHIPTMTYNTAFLLVLSSLCLGTLSLGLRTTSTILSLILLIISFISISQTSLGLDFGFDNILFNSDNVFGGRYSNQVSIFAAICFFLFAFSLLSLMHKFLAVPHIWLPGILATFMLMISMLGVYSFKHSYFPAHLLDISVYTATGIILLAIGMLLFASSLVESIFSKAVQFWISLLVSLGILMIVSLFYIAFTYEQQQSITRETEYDASDLFKYITARVSEIVNAMERAKDRYVADAINIDILWDVDSKSFIKTLPAMESMLLMKDRKEVVKHFSTTRFNLEEAMPTFLAALERNSDTYFTYRTPEGVQLLVIQYPLTEGRSLIGMFRVDQLIRTSEMDNSPLKFDLLVDYGGVVLCNTFTYSAFDKKRDYSFLYHHKMIGGIKLQAYMWPRETGIKKFQKMLPIMMLLTGGLLANFVGFLFYLIQKFKDLGEQLKAANKAKTSFLANVSHEVRTPLHSIIGTISLMRNMDLPQKEHRWMQIIGASARHLLNLINNLLDLTKIEANSFSFVSQPCNVKELSDDLLQFLSVKATEKLLPIHFEYNQDPTITKVKMPVQAFTQIFINLVGNAIKFTDKGSVTVSIDITSKNDEGFLDMRVSDSGIGIAPERHNEVFKKFVTIDSKATYERGGTGLGLYLTKTLVEELKGTITFDSKLGAGTTFHVHIPVEVNSD